jgi:hypothetical protein
MISFFGDDARITETDVEQRPEIVASTPNRHLYDTIV